MDKIELCSMLKELNKITWLKELVVYADLILPELVPKKCPIIEVK